MSHLFLFVTLPLMLRFSNLINLSSIFLILGRIFCNVSIADMVCSFATIFCYFIFSELLPIATRVQVLSLYHVFQLLAKFLLFGKSFTLITLFVLITLLLLLLFLLSWASVDTLYPLKVAGCFLPQLAMSLKYFLIFYILWCDDFQHISHIQGF